MITYRDLVTAVELGDRVEARIWFRRHTGRVVYLPGVSSLNRHMERDGLRWVGVRLDEGGFLSAVVDPERGCLRDKLRFLGRDSQSVPGLAPEADPHGDDSFGAPF